MTDQPKWMKPARKLKQDALSTVLYRIHQTVYHVCGVVAANQVIHRFTGYCFDLPEIGAIEVTAGFAVAGMFYLMFGYRIAALNRK